jgi:hypothetical protein
MNFYLILTHIFVAILAFVICCLWHKRKLKACMGKNDYDSSSLISDDATRILVDKFYDTLNDSFDPILIPPSSPSEPFTEAALAYVSFADLKKYMCFIEQLSIKNGFINISKMGIRMYYGRYPYTEQELAPYMKNNVVDASVVGRHTLVMVPTFRDGERDIDFNPHYIEKGCPMRIKSVRENQLQRKSQPAQEAMRTTVVTDLVSSTIDSGSSNYTSTNVNLNTFGLTPPKKNDNGDATYTP